MTLDTSYNSHLQLPCIYPIFSLHLLYKIDLIFHYNLVYIQLFIFYSLDNLFLIKWIILTFVI